MAFFISLAALALVALLLLRAKNMPAAVAPFLAVTGAALFLCAMGMAGAFGAAVAVIYIAAALSAALLLRDGVAERRELLCRFASPAMLFFLTASAVFYIILYYKQPWFQQWDEFSFWGIAAKNVFLHDELYTLFDSSMLSTSYAPALPLFSVFMQRLGGEFSEWRVMAAYDVLTAAALSLLFSRESFKKPLRVAVFALFSALGLYMLWHSFLGARLFATSHADLQLGIMFGGAMLAWFSSDERGASRYAACLCGLALLPMIKDTGMAFGLVGAVIISADMLVGRAYPFKKYNALAVAGLFAAVLLSYKAWNLHYAAVTQVDRAAYNYGYTAAQIFSGEDPFFKQILAKMFGEELATRQLVMFGPMIDMIVVFTALPLLCAPLCKSRRSAARLACGSLLLCAGYFAYYLFLAYAYTAIFHHMSDLYLVSFERYLSPYVAGWYLALVGLIKSEAGEWRVFLPKKLSPRDGGALAALAFTAAVFVFSPVPADQYLLTSPKVALPLSEMRLEAREVAQTLRETLPADVRLYLICQNSDGEEWFYLNYELQPQYLCRMLEGGTFMADDGDRGSYETFADAAQLLDYLEQNNAGYIVIERTDDYFDENFAQLFTDGLAAYKRGETIIYKKTGAVFAPVAG